MTGNTHHAAHVAGIILIFVLILAASVVGFIVGRLA